MKNNRKLTLVLFAIGCLCLALAFIVTISDNLPGILLLYSSIIFLILAFVHKWRESKRFKILLITSVIGIPVFAILHNLFYGLGKISADIVLLPTVLNFISVLTFLLAITICPMGLLVGIIGAAIVGRKK